MVSEEQESEMELASEKIPVPPVENPVEEPAEVEESKPEVPRKKPRKRNRELHAKILKQMEFYFGDANLGKDRFLAKLIAEDSWVDLEIFIKFNKIRTLTTDVKRIAKALKDSTMLEVSEDGTKVCRTTPILEKGNSDECTVYVQRLPLEADHEWISKIFSQHGPIDYISIPKYKNKAIKGFAFVEYKTQEDAKKCIQSFRAKGCVLPSQTSPNTLLSITTHEDCDEQIAKEIILEKVNKGEKMEVDGEESDLKKNESESLQDGKKKKKRISVDETPATDDDEHSKKSRKKKGSTESDSLSNIPEVEKETEERNEKCKKRKERHSGNSNTSDGNDEVNSSECSKKQKKNKRKSESESKVHETENQSEEESCASKKRKKTDNEKEINVEKNNLEEDNEEAMKEENESTDEMKEKSCETTEESQNPKGEKEKEKRKKRKRKRSRRNEENDGPEMGLEIMAKKEWKRLRNKYLEMQRAKMKQLKQHLKRSTWNHWQNAEKIKAEKEDVNEKDKDAVKEEKTPRFSYTPGVIVRIEMESPCSDPKNFKMELKGSSSNSAVQYVDVSEGANIAFVRCDSAESAKSLVQKTNDERTMIILEGEEEKGYWEKIAKDRQEKIGNNIRVKQRGRDKLLKKAEKELGKHIKFEEV